MKKSMFVLLVAVMAMSVTVFGADKSKSTDSTTMVATRTGVIKVSKPVVEPGEETLIIMEMGGGDEKAKYTFICNGDTVNNPHRVVPDTSMIYEIMIYSGNTFVGAGKVKVGVGTRLRLKKVMSDTFEIGKTDPKKLKGWRKNKEEVRSFLTKNKNSKFRKEALGTADLNGNGSEERNIFLANRRAKNTVELFGLDGVETGKMTGAQLRTVYWSIEETDESFFSRVMQSEIGMGIVVHGKIDTVYAMRKQAASPSPAPPIKIKSDRVRLTVGATYLQESPMESLGLRIPLAQDSGRVKSDIHLALHFGHDGHDFGWAASAQVDFTLGKGFFVGPILLGGQKFPDFGAIVNHSEVSLGGVLQYRLTNKVVAQLGGVCEYRSYFWVGDTKSQPDEVAPKVVVNFYYAF